MKECQRCGYINNDEDEFCRNCGTQILDLEAMKGDNSNIKKSLFSTFILHPKTFSVSLIFLILSVVAIVFFAFQVQIFRFDKSIYTADLIMLIFWSVAAFLCLLLLLLRLIIKIKKNKK